MSLAIVGSSGGMKSVFVQGVLNAMETAGFRADAYVGASGSALPAASAAISRCNYVGVHYWQRVHEVHQGDHDMGETMLIVIREWLEPLAELLFRPDVPRLLISASAVINEEAAAQTQGDSARRLGRKLLVNAARKDRRWVDQNLALHLFDTIAKNGNPKLTGKNLADVMYASLRMLHTSKIPVEVDGRPYIDTSYTSICPAVEMAQESYDQVIAISTEPGQVYRDIFQIEPIPSEVNGASIHIIQPEVDLKTMGVDFTESTAEGLVDVFHYGEKCGRAFLASWGNGDR